MKRGWNIRAQVSVFIIFAIIIVVAILGGLYFYNQNKNSYFNSLSIKPQIDSIKMSLDSCMKNTALESVKVIGFQGGYYNVPSEDSFDLGWMKIPFCYNEGKLISFDKKIIENQLSEFVDENLIECIKLIDTKEFNLSMDEIRTTSKIYPGAIRFTIDSTATIEKDTKTTSFELNKMPVSIDKKLSEMLEVANFICQDSKKNNGYICYNCISEMAKQRGIYADFLNLIEGERITLFVLSDNISNETGGENFIFEFLGKYKEEEKKEWLL